MNCGRGKELVVDELQTLLSFIQEEISRFEQERNELKASYHGRAPEEKTIVKDVLFMHNEFDKGINKFREIIDEIADIPTGSTAKLSKAEEFVQEIVSMQALVVTKHDLLQKALVQKINLQRLHTDANHRLNEVREQNSKNSYKIIEIKNYEHSNIFAKKVKFLNGEIQRLKEILARSERGGLRKYTSPELIENNYQDLSEIETRKKLEEIISENQKLEQAVAILNNNIARDKEFARNKGFIEEKRKRVKDLREKYEKSVRAPAVLRFSNEEDDCSKKIMMLDNIIGRKSSALIKPTSPTGRLTRNSSLLQDIEASLSRVRSIASPIPRN